MMEKSAFCLNSRRWIEFMDLENHYPETCPNEGDCDGCGYYVERLETHYLRRKRRILHTVLGGINGNES